MSQPKEKISIIICYSSRDPNRDTLTLNSIKNLLEEIPPYARLHLILEGSSNLPYKEELPNKEQLTIHHLSFANFLQGIRMIKDHLSEQLILIVTPGSYVRFRMNLFSRWLQALELTNAGLLLANHLEITSRHQLILCRVKSGDDPSNFIIPGRNSSPIWFYHGAVIGLSARYLSDTVLDTEVNYGFDYALRMGVLMESGSIFTIPEIMYEYKAGIPFFPGGRLQEQFEENHPGQIQPHFSYLFDPSRFEWAEITFTKFLKKTGAFLPEEYFNKSISSDTTLEEGISFVIPTYNRADFIHRAIESVIEIRKKVKPHLKFEAIIVDNGNDHTPQIVEAYQKQYPDLIRYFRVRNLTLGGTRNYGVIQARYNIIGQLDSDDILINDPVTRTLEIFRDEDIAMLVGTYLTGKLVNGDIQVEDTPITHDEFLINHRNPLLQFCFPGPGAPRYYRKEAILAAGGFPELMYGEDSVLSDTLVKMGFRFERDLTEPTYLALRHAGNTDSQETDPESLLEKNYTKYLMRKAILEEIKNIAKTRPF